MQATRRQLWSFVLGTALVLAFPASISAQKEETHETKKSSKANKTVQATDLSGIIWKDPGDISSLDLTYGAGGKGHAPKEDGTYKFTKEDLHGTSPKFYVEDSEGITWLVKLGEEAKPETVATRFVWAMGYFADQDYFLSTIHVSDIPRLKRPSKSIGAEGTVTNVRLKRKIKGEKHIANWSWFKNPFVGTKELNGLRVMMALINNWDLTVVNSKVYREEDGEVRYVVSDLGASFGKTGGPSSRSKGVLKDYREAKFIEHADAKYVDFMMATRPFLLTAPVNPSNFEKRSHIEDVARHIPRSDVEWIGQQLARLTPQQIRDAFRSAGYSSEEVEGYARAIEGRIANLNSL